MVVPLPVWTLLVGAAVGFPPFVAQPEKNRLPTAVITSASGTLPGPENTPPGPFLRFILTASKCRDMGHPKARKPASNKIAPGLMPITTGTHLSKAIPTTRFNVPHRKLVVADE